MGLTTAERARVHSPVGVWIGARTPPEIALSIMAEVVRAIRLDGLRPAGPITGGRPRQAIDPVCGMTVLIGPDTPHTALSGQDDWFCGAGCLQTFTRSAGRTVDGP
jgi:xanthine dehydrogenase accessory factor